MASPSRTWSSGEVVQFINSFGAATHALAGRRRLFGPLANWPIADPMAAVFPVRPRTLWRTCPNRSLHQD
jgi:hypothetical protein